MSALLSKIDDKNVATITLNRPLIHNAIDDQLIHELMNVLRDLEQKPQVRAVLLTGAGPSFCAGADLQWMRRMSTASQDDNLRDAEQLAGMLRRLNIFPRPTVALDHARTSRARRDAAGAVEDRGRGWLRLHPADRPHGAQRDAVARE